MRRLLAFLRGGGRRAPDSQQGSDAAETDGGDHWGEQAKKVESGEQPVAWTSSALVNSMYIHPAISGDPNINWFEYIAGKYFPQPVGRALSLGCGGGGLERHGVALNVAHSFDACDASAGAIKLAREMAEEAGIEERVDYRVVDLNEGTLPREHYEVVFASQSLHHVNNLEHCLDQAIAALKPGALFITNEYVGPNQFQWTDTQIGYAQELLDTLPDRLRTGIRSGQQKVEISRPTIEFMNKIDPTEAIRSADICPLLEQRFEIIEKKDFGGTLLQLVLDDIAGNFQDNPEDRRILESLMDRERELMESGAIGSDFTMIVARPKGV